MAHLHRREFIGAALGGLAGASIARCGGCQQEEAASPSSAAPGLSSLFLTWRTDPTTTMVVQWVGPEMPGVELRYGPAVGSDWRTAAVSVKSYPNTAFQVHRCELTGLTPGSEYRFQIGSETIDYRFRTMPARATNTIQFVSGGDAGIGAHAIGTNVLAAKQEPYFAFLGGDLAYDNGVSPDVFLRFLQNYRKHMVDARGRLIPMLSCLGNHEVVTGYRGKRTDAPQYLSVFDGFYPETTYGVLDVGDYLSLVMLDSGHIASIGGEQTSWLETALAERQDRPHLIVANHVPAYPSFRALDSSGVEQRRHWSPLYEKYNVDVVLEHHDHTFKRTHPLKDGVVDKYGVVYLGDGSWGKLRAPKPPEARPYLASVDEAYHLTVHRLEGDRRFHVALEESGKVADVCTTAGKRPARRG